MTDENKNSNEINETKKKLFRDLADKVITISANNERYEHSSEKEIYQSSSKRMKKILYHRKQKISESQRLNNYNLRK